MDPILIGVTQTYLGKIRSSKVGGPGPPEKIVRRSRPMRPPPPVPPPMVSTAAPDRSAVIFCWMNQGKVAVRNVVTPASQPEPASRLKSAMHDVNFLRSDSRCRRYVSDLSSIPLVSVMHLLRISSTISLHQHAWLLRRWCMHSLLSGDSGWHVRDADVEKKGCQDVSLWDVVLEAS